MIPISFPPITSVSGATAPASASSVGGIATQGNGAEFAARLGTDNAANIPLTGGVNATQSAVMPQVINEPTDFGHLAQQMISSVNQKQQVAGHLVRDVLAGGPTPVHQALIATEEAAVSFQMLTEMRNKVVEAYQEVMRMSV